MRKRFEGLFLPLLICAVLLISITAVYAGEKAGSPQEPMGDLVVILSTDDLPSAVAALRIANVAAKRGHKVTMLLRVKAIQLALRDTEYKIGGAGIQEKLAMFMKGGSRVFAGGGCMKMDGISPKRLISGVRVGTPDTVMGMLFAKGARIICQ